MRIISVVRSAVVAASLLAASVALNAPAARAGQLVLAPQNVIGGSGSWDISSFNQGQYAAGNVFSSQLVAVSEPDQTGFWLGKEADTSEFFVVDLSSAYGIQRIELYNTHNGVAGDRAARDFEIFASNSITQLISGETGAGGFDLSDAVSLGTGTLDFQAVGDDPIEAFSFAPITSGPYRYVKFQFNSIQAAPGVTATGGGLSEMKVFTAPEPGSFALLAPAALPVIGAAIRRRRRAAA